MCSGAGDVLANVGSLGLIGFDEGGFKLGLTGQAAKEGVLDPTVSGLKEVSGAKAAEDANELQREQIEEEKANRLKDREDAKAASAAEQLRQSRSAGTSRSTSSKTTGLTSASTVGDDERDFLGL